MTELDAYEIATKDATQDAPRLQGAKTPDELIDAVFHRMLFRISQLNDGDAHSAALAAYQLHDPQAPHHLSLILATKTVAILEASKQDLHPEDMRALLLWTSGSQQQGPGYLQHLIHQNPDSGTQIALQQIGQYTAETYKELDGRDRHMFTEMIKTLPHGATRAIRGLLMEAKWCNADDDGEGARIKIIGARRLATMLLKNQIRSDRYFYDIA